MDAPVFGAPVAFTGQVAATEESMTLPRQLARWMREQYREFMGEDYGVVWYVPEEEGGLWSCTNMTAAGDNGEEEQEEEEQGGEQREERGRWVRKRPTQAEAVEKVVEVTAKRLKVKEGGIQVEMDGWSTMRKAESRKGSLRSGRRPDVGDAWEERNETVVKWEELSRSQKKNHNR